MAKSTVFHLALISALFPITFATKTTGAPVATVATETTKATETTAGTTTPTEATVPSLCLDVNRITLTGIPYNSQLKFANTQGIFYVYDPLDSFATFKQFRFPIIPDTMEKSVPTQFNFKDDASTVFCWTNPAFMSLNVRFKVYSFYHTAMKAVSEVSIPLKEAAPKTVSLELSTLPYQYGNATVSVNFTFAWNTNEQVLVKVHDAPPIPPVQPPVGKVDAEAAMDLMTDNIIAQDQPVSVGGEHQTSSDWMFIAALCSSVLGLFVLVYICVWAYRSYGRKEYESISSGLSSANVCAKGRKRISLRNIEISDDIMDADNEQKSIMHPSSSYTFQRE
eukprot:13773_1